MRAFMVSGEVATNVPIVMRGDMFAKYLDPQIEVLP
jgi:hypothetical protein